MNSVSLPALVTFAVSLSADRSIFAGLCRGSHGLSERGLVKNHNHKARNYVTLGAGSAQRSGSGRDTKGGTQTL